VHRPALRLPRGSRARRPRAQGRSRRGVRDARPETLLAG
jgi:hypothetical protein